MQAERKEKLLKTTKPRITSAPPAAKSKLKWKDGGTRGGNIKKKVVTKFPLELLVLVLACMHGIVTRTYNFVVFLSCGNHKWGNNITSCHYRLLHHP